MEIRSHVRRGEAVDAANMIDVAVSHKYGHGREVVASEKIPNTLWIWRRIDNHSRPTGLRGNHICVGLEMP
jgi:hypothetical protein